MGEGPLPEGFAVWADESLALARATFDAQAESLAPEEERNVVPETDDEELDEGPRRFIEHGATHFSSRFRPNQRTYPQSRGEAK